MRLMFRTLATAVAVVALSGAAFAGQAKSAAKSTKAPKATVITTTGTISKFDSASNTLTLTTSKGDASFTVDASASIMEGSKKVMASDLAGQTGHKATVHYTESNGQKMAQSVTVAAASKSASTSTKKASTPKKS